ncbi:MAG: hypothetical protein ACI4BA_05800 [Prevotella sp.]
MGYDRTGRENYLKRAAFHLQAQGAEQDEKQKDDAGGKQRNTAKQEPGNEKRCSRRKKDERR